MDPVDWIRTRFAPAEPLGAAGLGLATAPDRLVPGRRALLKLAREADARRALETELSELLRLVHPALRGLLASGANEAERLLALEWIDGEDLSAHLRRRPEGARGAAIAILRALVHLHAHSRAHGDLKPSNVLVDPSGPRLIDLGLATPLGAPARGGTGGFLAPEHLRGEPVSVAGDLYALGASLRASGAALDERLERLVVACLSPSPEARPASADGALGMLGATPRPLDRLGRMPRAGGTETLRTATSVAEALSGETLVVEAPPGAGRSRLASDLLLALVARDRPVADCTLRSGLDLFAVLGRLLAPDLAHDDPARRAALTAAAAARAGVVLLLDDADRACPAVADALPLVAATLAELGRGGLVVVGADAAMTDRLASVGATRATLDPVGPAEVVAMLEAAGAPAEPAVAEALAAATAGRTGHCARAALLLGESPGESAVEAARLVLDLGRAAGPDRPDDEPAPEDAVALAEKALEEGEASRAAALLENALVSLPEGASRRQAEALLARAEAARGRLDAAVARVEGQLASAPAELRLDAARWLERLGRYEEARRHGLPLLNAREPDLRAAAAAVVAQSAFGLGEPEAADRIAAAALAPGGLPAALACRLLCIRSDAALTRGEPGLAVARAVEATAAARKQADPTLLPLALAREAAGRALGGDPRAARDRYRDALEAALEAGDVVGLPPHILNLATAEHALGELGSAIERYQQAARLAAKLDRQVARAAALVNWAALLVDIGAVDEATGVLEDAVEAARTSGSALYAAQAELVRAALVGRSDPTTGRRVARGARSSFLACGAARQALEAELLEAELALEERETGPGLELVGTRVEELERGGLAARALGLEARARLAAGDAAAALEAAERAADRARRDGAADLEARSLATLALAHASLGTGAERPTVLRAQEALGRVAARLPPGLRERYLRDPARLALARLGAVANAEDAPALGREPERLLGLVRRILLEGSEAGLLEAAVDEAVELVGAERAFLLRRRPTGRPRVAVARNMGRETIRRGGSRGRFSRSVAERVLESGEQVVTASASDDPALRGARSVLDLGLRSILCVPIRGPSGVAGALYLDHRFESARFGPRACALVQALADIIGVALENARLRDDAEAKAGELETANAALARENLLRAAEVDRLGRLLDRGGAPAGDAPGGMVGRSAALRRALEVARRVGPSRLPVLVEGPSGTGKELLARFVHDCSPRREGPFLAINCGAVPESLLESELFGHVRGAFTGAGRDHAGLFRSASGGTLLLDEIGEMSVRMQPRLLRVLQQGEVWPVGLDAPVPVDVRVVAATNRDLAAEVEAGRFRRDLYFRLVGVRLLLPPLVERLEDLPALAETILGRIATEPGMRRASLSKDAARMLLRHDWPGNVRELEQTLRRAVLLAEREEVRPEDLELPATAKTRKEALRGFDQEIVGRALAAARGNRSAAARTLGVSRSTLHRWMARYGLG